jgi:hypothetical protein
MPHDPPELQTIFDQREQHVGTQYNAGRDLHQEQHFHVLSAHDRTNRERMLTQVFEFWVRGVLEKSLYREVLIDLGLTTDPQAVEAQTIRYAGLELTAEGAGEPQPLPADTSIADAFAAAQQQMLILGEPGAVKTTLLLDLARTLLHAAAADERRPIPVVFNLSSWARACAAAGLADQRGVARPQGAGCDIGAVEGAAEPLVRRYLPLVRR